MFSPQPFCQSWDARSINVGYQPMKVAVLDYQPNPFQQFSVVVFHIITFTAIVFLATSLTSDVS